MFYARNLNVLSIEAAQTQNEICWTQHDISNLAIVNGLDPF